MARLLSVNVGLPRDVDWNGKTTRTAAWKSPVEGRLTIRTLNIEGDSQADLAGHGGEQRAVFVYQMDSFTFLGGVISVSASSARTSQLRDLRIKRSASVIDTGLVMRYLK
jgi:MOSC domain-containing protein YiiM